mmetsp:Transcript_83606/g.97784  ORF Transcript_83606/g.97784 Transcript_83606/m.97784 type:complete len:305 (+) Transcript_83606:70-984(+)
MIATKGAIPRWYGGVVCVWIVMTAVIEAANPSNPIPTGYTPVPCIVPNIPEQFYMIEGYSANYNQDTFPSYMSAQAIPTEPIVTSGSSIYSVRPMCLDVTKAINLYQGSDLILMYSDLVGGAGFPALKVMSICGNDIAFIMYLDEKTFEYEFRDQSGACMAVAKNTITSVVQLVDCNRSTMFASAVKHAVDQPIVIDGQSFPAMAYWNATILPSLVPQQWSPSIFPFLMAVKDNLGMDCTPTPAPIPAPIIEETSGGLSSGVAIVIAVLVSGFVALGVFVGMRRFYKRSDYAEMRQAINDAHEA